MTFTRGNDIVRGSSFAEIMARAPILREQGGNLSEIPAQNLAAASGIVNSAMNNAAAIKQQQIDADMRLQIAQMQDASTQRTRRATALVGLLPVLSSGGLFGGGSRRMAGQDLLTGLLSGAMGGTSPTGFITSFTDLANSLGNARSAISPWSAASRAATSEALAQFRG